MKKAVVRIKGRQYLVDEGEEFLVNKIQPNDISAEVLLVIDGENISLGKPVCKDKSISFEVVNESIKGNKVHIRKYKAKSRYRRHIGFRSQSSLLRVTKIG